MKNEDLYVYKKSDFYEDYISSQKEYYEREQVDTLLAEKDFEIDRLKEFNVFLKQRNSNGDVGCSILLDDLQQKDEEIAKLKQKLEDVQASAYAESVDAGMRERRLRKALWMTRAERASEKVDLFWYARASTELLNINGRPDRIPEPKGWWRQLKATEWLRIWQKVERKCRAKAEEYK